LTNRYRQARRAFEHVVFGLAAPALTIWTLAVVWAHDGHGEDFRLQYWLAGWRTLHGISPYAGLHAPVDAALAFPYPASTALFFVPFALLQRAPSGDLYTAFCLSAPALSLWTLGVRDWRLYGLVMLLAPVVSGWQTANLTLILGLGMAILWRFRDRQILASAIAAALVSLKPFLWPLVLWLLVTRRWRSTVYTVLGVAAIQLASWSVLGFDQIHRFLRVTFSVTHTFRGWGYSIASSAMHLGAGSEVATVVAVLVSVGLVVALLLQLRRNSDSTALVLAVTLALCASPIVWAHYFALLLIPLAVLRPRLSPVWVCLVPLWLCPLTNPDGWQADVALATLVGTVCALLWAAESGSQGRTASRFLPGRPELAERDSLAVSVSDA
jgi:alpha-1,2-mannosyltransferase